MAGSRRLTVEILGDAKGLASGIREADGHLSTLGSKIGNFAKTAAVAFTGASVAAGAFLVPAIKGAAELEDTVSKTYAVFGDMGADLVMFSKGAATAFGLTKREALDAASTFGILGKSAGFRGKDLVNFSEQMVALSADLTSFFGGSTEEAITAIGAAFRGETEPIRKYGVMLDDATLRQRALKMGLIKTTKDALTPQQKALAAHQEILAQTTDAQGDFAKTSNGASNQMRIMRAQLGNLTDTIGTMFLPLFTRAVTWFNTTATPAIKRLTQVFDEEGLSGVVKLLARSVADATPKVLSALGDMISKMASWLIDTGFPAVGSAIAAGAPVLWAWIKDPALPATLHALGEWAGAIGSWIIDTGLPAVGSALQSAAHWLWDWIKDKTPDVLKALAELSMKMGEWLGSEGPKWAARAAEWIATDLPAWINKKTSEVDWGNLLFDAGKKMSEGMLIGFMVGPGSFLLGLGKGTGAIQKGNILSGAEGRATGGPVMAGKPYWVGERGVPELFVPNQSGSIVPAENMGGNVSVYVNALDSSSISPQLARKLADSIRRELAAVR